MAYELPALPYAADALEPHIDARTVEIHHGKHHAAYVANLNAALKEHPELAALPLGDLLADLSQVPEEIRTAVRNNGGGVWNHQFYFESLAPGAGGCPVGPLMAAISATFGSFVAFQEKMQAAALARFGSGWAWLSLKPDGSLCVCSTPNQDNPFMRGIAECPGQPLLVVDVWEHAYYLKYQNLRADYVKAWWNVVNWRKVEERYVAAGGV